MNEKEKETSQPFAGVLRPTEKILWVTAYRVSARNEIILAALVFLTLNGIFLGVQLQKPMPLNQFLPILIIGLTFGILLLRRVIIQWRKRGVTAYALTNERMLYRRQKNIIAIPLEKLPPVSLFLGEGTKGTFSFGAFFPMWPNVNNAVKVKRLMDDAQKQCLERVAK